MSFNPMVATQMTASASNFTFITTNAPVTVYGNTTTFYQQYAVVNPAMPAVGNAIEDDIAIAISLLTIRGYKVLPQHHDDPVAFALDSVGEYRLPDGTRISVNGDGNFQLDDKDAKVVYKANRIREFNPYVNASDLLERFIEEAGRLGVEQTRMLKLPVEAFINWLIREAAKKDGDKLDGLPLLEDALA